ncbi:hypothetical protein GCM10009639_69050 [Kitasatospora putterlickiae]|uniref:Apolipoprotein N-acyltransferase n=1 Tax=Kitasatospora putterlickiae TaxID=221725 RepID=A0ABN1YNL5_9ACTN
MTGETERVPARRRRLGSRLAVLGERDFRWFFVGYATSLVGSSMAPVAVAFAVLDGGGGGTELGWVMAARILPIVLVMVAGGVVADRLGGRRVMLAADVLRCAVQGGFAALLATGHASLPVMVALVAVWGLGEGVFLPALGALVPGLVRRKERLPDANTLLGLARSVSTVAGPALAGVITAGFGPGAVLLIDAVTYGVGALALARLSAVAPADPGGGEDSLLADLRDGWGEFRARRWLWVTTVQMALFNFLVWAPFLVLGPLTAQRELGGARAWGLVMGVYGMGAVLGGLLMLGRRPGRPLAVATVAGLGWALPSAALAAGALPVLAFPAPGVAALAWVALVPGLLLMRRAPGAREAAVRGWWFGAGFILAGMSWLLSSVGPALPLIAVVFGSLQAAVGVAVWRLLRPPLTVRRALLAPPVVAAVWLTTEYARSWPALGGPWALLGATQWQHPAVLALASAGGIWLVSAAVVAVNTAVLVVLTAVEPRPRAAAALLAGATLAAGRLLFAMGPAPASAGDGAEGPEGPARVRIALVQPGIVDEPQARFEASARATAALVGQRPVDLVVWGESSTTADLDREPAALDRLRALSAATGAGLLAGEDARKADGRISKDAVLVSPDGVVDRYRKIRLVPFGEYIPLRPVLGWVAGVSRAAGENRAPGGGQHLLPTVDRSGRALPVGALICFESAFPDMARTAARDGARVLVYQSSTSTFQHGWAPEQHVSLAAIRAAETGRPAVQASLTGVSAAFDAQGRELARLGTDDTGALVVDLPLTAPDASTWYLRVGDVVPLTAVLVTVGAAALALRPGRRRQPPLVSER